MRKYIVFGLLLLIVYCIDLSIVNVDETAWKFKNWFVGEHVIVNLYLYILNL